MCVIVLNCIVLYLFYWPVLHCSTPPLSINPFAVHNNNNNTQSGAISESSLIANVSSQTFIAAT